MAMGFNTNFDIIDNAFVNISTRGFAIDFNCIDNVFANDFKVNNTASVDTLLRGFATNFDVINFVFTSIYFGVEESPSTSSTLPSPPQLDWGYVHT
jgi:hypothetical protein